MNVVFVQRLLKSDVLKKKKNFGSIKAPVYFIFNPSLLDKI